jgi:RecB family exonuclease
VAASSPLVRQVCTLIDEDPTAPLVVFLPRRQLGLALQAAVARRRGASAGLTATTLQEQARTVAEVPLLAAGRTALSPGPRFFLTLEIIRGLSDPQQEALLGDQPRAGLAGPLARTFTTLRAHGITPEAYRRAADDDPQRRAQATAFARYRDQLDEHAYVDAPALLQTATRLVRDGRVSPGATRYAVLDTVSLTGREHAFLSALAAEAPASPGLWRLGVRPPTEADANRPSSLAAAQFEEAPSPAPRTAEGLGRVVLDPQHDMTPATAERIRFWTATGTRREVQAVFEDLLAQDRPLDTVELAYTTPAPYLPLIDSLAERYDLPVSLSGGRAVDATRPGQALGGFFDWVATGGAIPDLIELLRAGLLQVDRPIGGGDDPADTLDGRALATLLAQRRYADDPTTHPDTLAQWADRVTNDLRDLTAGADAGAWVDRRRATLHDTRARIEAAQAVVEELLALAHLDDHTPVSTTEFAASAETVLERFGPTPAPSDEEDERTPDQAARNRLIERLRTLAEAAPDRRERPRRLARTFTNWLSLSPYVRAQRPQPGRIHVVPLESAGVADRDHLYVVGLDAASVSTTMADDPLLDDAHRGRLAEAVGAPLPRAHAAPDREDVRTRQALARHTGTLTLAASTYDLGEGEDLFEAPLYLRLKEASQAARGAADDAADPQVRHHPLTPDRPVVLSRLDRWTSRPGPGPDALDDALEHDVPWIRDGLQAAAARASTAYTPYDGLLEDDAYPGLNPLARNRPVTAGQLESYARGPFAYFLRHVLDVEPLDEPALDDVAWLDARGRGAVLHETFRRFMDALRRRPTREDEPRLREHFDAALEARRDEHPPPSEVVYATTRRALWQNALLFLRVEAADDDGTTPAGFEVGFGYPPHRRQPQDYADAPTLSLGDLSFALRGRVDRIDRGPDGRLSLWDYKTGSARRYDATDLLDGGRHLQWALYAYALEGLTGQPVERAGYFFTNTDEMGKRIAAAPAAHREAVADRLQQIAAAIEAGAFPVTDADDLRYSFDPLFPSFGDRRSQLRAKDWPDDRPVPPALQ